MANDPTPKKISIPMDVTLSWGPTGVEWDKQERSRSWIWFWICVLISFCCGGLSFFYRCDPLATYPDYVSAMIAGSIGFAYLVSVVGAIYYHRRIVWMHGYCVGVKHGVLLRNSGGIRRFEI